MAHLSKMATFVASSRMRVCLNMSNFTKRLLFRYLMLAFEPISDLTNVSLKAATHRPGPDVVGIGE